MRPHAYGVANHAYLDRLAGQGVVIKDRTLRAHVPEEGSVKDSFKGYYKGLRVTIRVLLGDKGPCTQILVAEWVTFNLFGAV